MFKLLVDWQLTGHSAIWVTSLTADGMYLFLIIIFQYRLIAHVSFRYFFVCRLLITSKIPIIITPAIKIQIQPGIFWPPFTIKCVGYKYIDMIHICQGTFHPDCHIAWSKNRDNTDCKFKNIGHNNIKRESLIEGFPFLSFYRFI